MPRVTNRVIDLALSDGTPVELVKVTKRGNYQVRVPATHSLGRSDPLRIFTPDGRHYKGYTSLTLVNRAALTGEKAAPAPTTAHVVEIGGKRLGIVELPH